MSSDITNAFNFLAAWLLFILIIVALAQTEIGKKIVYYVLWLGVVFVLVSHSDEITSIFKSAGIVNG
jgi:hypothetical protein